MDERRVLEQFRILLKDRRTGRVLEMRFDRDRPFGPHHLHQGGDEEDAVEIVGFLVGGAAEHLDDPAAQRLQILARIADDERADRGAADDEHFVRQRFEHRRQIAAGRSEEHTSELQSLMRISYAVFCLKKKKTNQNNKNKPGIDQMTTTSDKVN